MEVTMRVARDPTTPTLGELVEALTRAAEDGARTPAEAHTAASHALVSLLIGAGRADLVERLNALAAELAEDGEGDDGRARTAVRAQHGANAAA